MAVPVFSLSSSIRSRICAWMVTSSAVVGSSAISTCGSHDERHGDHHALAHAARELVRILVEPAACGSAMRTRSSISQRPLARGRPRHAHVAHDVLGDLRADGQHRIEAGHRLLEDHRDAMAAQALHLLLRTASSARCPRSGSSPGRCGRSRAGSGAGSRAPSPTCRSPIRPRCPASRRAPGRTTRRRPRARRRRGCRTASGGRGPRGWRVTGASPVADRAGRAGRRPAGSPPAR